MNPDIQRILEESDTSGQCYSPEDFDWAQTRARVFRLIPEFERISGQPVSLDDSIQDATFSFEVSIHSKPNPKEIVYAIRFSNYGNLFTTWIPEMSEGLDESVQLELIQATASQGFQYISSRDLFEDYSGRDPGFLGHTWWYRYFDYL